MRLFNLIQNLLVLTNNILKQLFKMIMLNLLVIYLPLKNSKISKTLFFKTLLNYNYFKLNLKMITKLKKIFKPTIL